MTIEVDYDESIDAIVITSKNVIGYKEVYLLRDKLLNHPCFRENINQLFDSTESEFDITIEDLIKISPYYKEAAT